MAEKKRIWKWYQRHRNSVGAILDISCNLVPGGAIVLGAVKAVNAVWSDYQDAQENEQVEQVEKLLEEIQPVVRDLVEDVEDLSDFQNAETPEQAKQAIQNSELMSELTEIIPQISPSISRSASALQKEKPEEKILNGKYQLGTKLGSGGQGEVYYGVHQLAKSEVAIKILPEALSNDTTAIAKLQQEYRYLVKSLTHPNIVQYRDLDRDQKTGRYFLVMDYVPSKTLRHQILHSHGKPMSLAQVVPILTPVAKALDFAHQNKIVHCDLKPENILIRNEDQEVFLTDFGLAKEIRTSLSRISLAASQNPSGTIPYMAPEQYLGKPATAQTDLWALGIIAYEMLSGFHPFQGTSFDHYMKLICEIDPDPIDHLNSHEWQALKQVLTKDRSLRSKSAEEFIQSLTTKSISQQSYSKLSSPVPDSQTPQVSTDKEFQAKPPEVQPLRDQKPQVTTMPLGNYFSKVTISGSNGKVEVHENLVVLTRPFWEKFNFLIYGFRITKEIPFDNILNVEYKPGSLVTPSYIKFVCRDNNGRSRGYLGNTFCDEDRVNFVHNREEFERLYDVFQQLKKISQSYQAGQITAEDFTTQKVQTLQMLVNKSFIDQQRVCSKCQRQGMEKINEDPTLTTCAAWIISGIIFSAAGVGVIMLIYGIYLCFVKRRYWKCLHCQHKEAIST